jgi:hypothetical protein
VTAFDAGRLSEVPVAPLAVTRYYRQCRIGSPANPLDVRASVPSRWHTHEGTLYLADANDPDRGADTTAWAEYCRYVPDRIDQADPTGTVGLDPANFAFYEGRELGPPVVARALFTVSQGFPAVADLTTAAARQGLRAAGVDPDTDLLADDYGPCPDIAKVGCARLGWKAVRYASAALPGATCLAVFRGSLPPAAAFKLVTGNGRPTVAVAYVTRYKAGERPSWLGPRPPAA